MQAEIVGEAGEQGEVQDMKIIDRFQTLRDWIERTEAQKCSQQKGKSSGYQIMTNNNITACCCRHNGGQVHQNCSE
jgi:uncharacterized small protein (DUF1192 family)